MKTRCLMVALCCFIALIIISCSGNNHFIHARDSLTGQWTVKAAFQRTAIIVNGTEESIIEQQESGDLGTFIFSENEMEYQYSFVTDRSDQQNYNFKTTKENAGFTQIDRYDIIGKKENYRVRFGDETDDAHCDAVEMALEQSITTDSLNVYLRLEITKDM